MKAANKGEVRNSRGENKTRSPFNSRRPKKKEKKKSGMKNWDEKNLLRYAHAHFHQFAQCVPIPILPISVSQSQPPRRTRWEAILALQKPNDALKLHRDEILEQVS